jgi:hypothetical protein
MIRLVVRCKAAYWERKLMDSINQDRVASAIRHLSAFPRMA